MTLNHALMPVATDPHAPLPSHLDVAVIGGGAAGVATAYELHKLGKRVGVFEKGRIAAEQSSRNWGWCRTLGRDLRELDMAKLGVARWSDMASEIGADVGFRASGVTFVTQDPQELADWEAWRAAAQRADVHADMLSRDAANHAWPTAGAPWLGGIRVPNDGYAEPVRAIPLLAQYAMRQGVTIRQHCAVNDLYYQAGQLAGIVTEHGVVRSDAVVLAGGVWSSLFCLKHGITLPTLNVHASASKTQAVVNPAYTEPVRTPDFSLRPRDDGGYTLAQSGRGIVHLVPNSLRYGWRFKDMYARRRQAIRLRLGSRFFGQLWDEIGYRYLGRSPFTRHRICDPAPNSPLVQSAYAALHQTFPAFASVTLDHAWGGVIDHTPDGIPVVSASAIDGLSLCTGFSGHGFGSSLGAGRMLAQLIATGQAPAGLAQLSHARLLSRQSLAPNIIY